MTRTDPEAALRALTRKIAAADRRRDQLTAERDQLLVDFVEAGGSWSAAQRVSGLSRRGVQLAMERARASQLQPDVARATPASLIEIMPWLERLDDADQELATAELIAAARADRLSSVIIRWRDKAGRV